MHLFCMCDGFYFYCACLVGGVCCAVSLITIISSPTVSIHTLSIHIYIYIYVYIYIYIARYLSEHYNQQPNGIYTLSV